MSNANSAEILILRATECDNQHDKYLQCFKDAKINSHILPALQFCFINLEILKDYLINSVRFCGIIFTSQRSLSALERCVQNNPTLSHALVQEWSKLPAFCIGYATQQREIRYVVIDVYKSVPRNDLEKAIRQFISLQGIPRCIIFFSPSVFMACINILKEIQMIPPRCHFAAIGPTTAKSITDHGYNVDCHAREPDPEGLLQAISRFLQSSEK
ncbi:Uroporphyrinogen-III synthase [Trichoplax sp. H2]|nr:Uroporphyrinogen-III synthase [Trichoplax sp. H2]|eukprot:RDD38600.1 Uroporphyrinogen-III synthase [Trichoplax sp. H2]